MTAPSIRSSWLLGLLCATTLSVGCAAGGTAPELVLRLPDDVFVRDATGAAFVSVEIENTGDATAFSTGCAATPAGKGLNWDLERREAGVWSVADAFFACAPPTIGTFRLGGGDAAMDTVRIHQVGTWRVVLFFQASAEGNDWRAARSSSFEVTN